MAFSLPRELRLAVRSLLKSRAFTAAAVLTMAMGICATVSMFTVVNSIVLRPLPFPESHRVVSICETSARRADLCLASPANVMDIARTSRTLDAAGVARTETFVQRGDEGSSGVSGGIATPGFFHALGMRAALGRLIEDSDLNRASNAVAVVSHAFWQRALHADPLAIGRALSLDGRAVTIVGVLSPDAYVPELGSVDVWKPLTASVDNVDNRSWRGFTAIGRVAAGSSTAEARAELETIRAQLAAAYPDANAEWGLRLVDLHQRTVAPARATLWIFFGATALVLLIACANVAGLLLVRAARRAPEFAVRSALGAGRRRLAAQLLAESVVLSLAGGSLGLLLASWTTRGFVAFAPASLPRLTEVSIDGRVAAFSLAVSLLTAMLFGFAPARQAAAAGVAATLRGGRHGTRRDMRLRSALVVVEVALALVLLLSAGLLTRTFGRLLRWEPGFEREGLVTSWVLAPSETYRQPRAAVGLLERVRASVATASGVRSVALASAGPMFGGVESDALSIEGGESVSDAAPVNWFDVSPEYFNTLGVRFVKGRGFSEADREGAPNVAVVNESLARRFFGSPDAIGRRVTVMSHTSEIVGVVADVRPYRPDRPPPPEIYWPIRQYPRLAAYLVMRVEPGIDNFEKTLRTQVAAVDSRLQVTAVVSVNERLARALVNPRFNMILLGSFAVVALALAAVGVFGVIAYSVASRTRELGLRIALGASPGRLARDVARHGLVLAVLGMIAGVAGALATGRLLSTMLYGLAATDWVTWAGTIVAFGLVAGAASYLPARRAARIDPLAALKEE